jgi:hypothetical protein
MRLFSAKQGRLGNLTMVSNGGTEVGRNPYPVHHEYLSPERCDDRFACAGTAGFDHPEVVAVPAKHRGPMECAVEGGPDCSCRCGASARLTIVHVTARDPGPRRDRTIVTNAPAAA